MSLLSLPPGSSRAEATCSPWHGGESKGQCAQGGKSGVFLRAAGNRSYPHPTLHQPPGLFLSLAGRGFFPVQAPRPCWSPLGPSQREAERNILPALGGKQSLSLTHAKGMWGLGAGHGTDRRAPGAQGQGGGAWQSPMALRPPVAAPSAATCGPLGFRSYGHTDHFLEAVTVRTEDRVMCGAQQ